MPRPTRHRTRKAPVHFSPIEGGPMDDDYTSEQHDDTPLEEMTDSDVTSIATSSASEDSSDLSDFIVGDNASVGCDACGDNEDDEEEWESEEETSESDIDEDDLTGSEDD